MFGRKIYVGDVGCHTMSAGVGNEFFLAVQIGLGLPGFDGAFFKRFTRIGNHETKINPNHSTKTLAGLAGTNG